MSEDQPSHAVFNRVKRIAPGARVLQQWDATYKLTSYTLGDHPIVALQQWEFSSPVLV
jgi:hypothetical protein